MPFIFIDNITDDKAVDKLAERGLPTHISMEMKTTSLLLLQVHITTLAIL